MGDDISLLLISAKIDRMLPCWIWIRSSIMMHLDSHLKFLKDRDD